MGTSGRSSRQIGVKPSMYYFEGRARVFNYMEDANHAVSNGMINEGDVIVIRYEGPKADPVCVKCI